MKKVRLIIFAKAPLAGISKTRLIPTLGEKGAAKLAKQLLLYTVNNALLSSVDSVELCVFPNPESEDWQQDDVFEQINAASKKARKHLVWSAQSDGDLGARLLHAAKQSTENDEYVLLIGTDCPSLTPKVLQQAKDELMAYNAVINPATDGGYVLLGLQSVDACLFENMPWSTSSVCTESLKRMQSLQWNVSLLSVLHDIDESEDLQWLPESWPDRNSYCPKPLVGE